MIPTMNGKRLTGLDKLDYDLMDAIPAGREKPVLELRHEFTAVPASTFERRLHTLAHWGYIKVRRRRYKLFVQRVS